MIYNSFNHYLRQRFNCRVQRIALGGGFTCPNIDGTRGRGGCRFCDVSGSLAAYARPSLSITEQVRHGIAHFERRANAQKYIAYFQSYTATHEQPERLRALMDEALAADPRVVGLALGSRPDCLNNAMLDFLQEFHARTELWLDVGLESSNDATLARVNRCATTAEFLDAIRRAKARGLRICAHVIFGLPGDSEQDMLRCIDWINELQLDGIKLHNLYIDSHSAFGVLWQRGEIPMLSREEYIDLVCRAIARLRPEVLIHRLTGEAPRGRHLAPDWAANKQELLAAIHAELARRNITQGQSRVRLLPDMP